MCAVFTILIEYITLHGQKIRTVYCQIEFSRLVNCLCELALCDLSSSKSMYISMNSQNAFSLYVSTD